MYISETLILDDGDLMMMARVCNGELKWVKLSAITPVIFPRFYIRDEQQYFGTELPFVVWYEHIDSNPVQIIP